MSRLAGKVALITGAASGMGAAEAELFAGHGASVVLADVQDSMGEEIARSIRQSGGSASYVHLDVSETAQWQEAMNAVVNLHGQLDILVNNAGIFSGRAVSVEGYRVDEWERVMAVNATGVFLGTRFGSDLMRVSGRGSIVNVSSIYGLVGAPSEGPYPSSKGAVRSLTKAAAVQLAPHGIRVNSVHPGFIDTPQSSGLMDDPAQRAKLVERTPIGRIGTSEDIAWGVLYLACDESAYVTGAEFVIDGGITAR